MSLFKVERIMERVAERRSTMTSPSGAETLKIEIRRDANGGLGLSIAGGLESTPYKVFCSLVVFVLLRYKPFFNLILLTLAEQRAVSGREFMALSHTSDICGCVHN